MLLLLDLLSRIRLSSLEFSSNQAQRAGMEEKIAISNALMEPEIDVDQLRIGLVGADTSQCHGSHI